MKNHIPDELQEKLNLKKNKVLIGDAIEDKKMVPEEQWDETILVGFLNENIKNNLEKSVNLIIIKFFLLFNHSFIIILIGN